MLLKHLRLMLRSISGVPCTILINHLIIGVTNLLALTESPTVAPKFGLFLKHESAKFLRLTVESKRCVSRR